MNTERVGVGGRQSADSLAGHSQVPATEESFLDSSAYSPEKQEGGCQREK